MAESSGVDRLVEVMARLRAEDDWDAEQTHRSLVPFLVEEACELIEAIEDGTEADLVEELGDLLFHISFHCAIGAEQQRFDLAEVADRVTDKLVRRHPHIFADDDAPEDPAAAWEAAKAQEKARTSSLDGIPYRLSALARTAKVLDRAASRQVPLELPAVEPISADELGEDLLALTLRARASGLDAEQVMRDVLRRLESQVQAAEA